MTDMKSSASLSMIKCIEASKVMITILTDHVPRVLVLRQRGTK